jgi:hypothetical protein
MDRWIDETEPAIPILRGLRVHRPKRQRTTVGLRIVSANCTRNILRPEIAKLKSLAHPALRHNMHDLTLLVK